MYYVQAYCSSTYQYVDHYVKDATKLNAECGQQKLAMQQKLISIYKVCTTGSITESRLSGILATAIQEQHEQLSFPLD